jgi:hypothetical protein
MSEMDQPAILRPTLRLLVAIPVCIALAILVAQVFAWEVVAHTGGSGLASIDRLKAVSDVRGQVVQLIGVVGVITGLWYTARTYFLSRATQTADRFLNATKQISEDLVAVRIAGIFGLHKIAKFSPDYWPLVDRLLSAFIRERATNRQKSWDDVHAALSVIGAPSTERPQREVGPAGERLDLRNTYLSDCDLSHLILDRARFDSARLGNADLRDAHLTGAILANVDAWSATFSGAILIGADLTGAKLCGSDFRQVQLDKAHLEGADLLGVRNLTKEQLKTTTGIPRRYPTEDFLRG